MRDLKPVIKKDLTSLLKNLIFTDQIFYKKDTVKKQTFLGPRLQRFFTLQSLMTFFGGTGKN